METSQFSLNGKIKAFARRLWSGKDSLKGHLVTRGYCMKVALYDKQLQGILRTYSNPDPYQMDRGLKILYIH